MVGMHIAFNKRKMEASFYSEPKHATEICFLESKKWSKKSLFQKKLQRIKNEFDAVVYVRFFGHICGSIYIKIELFCMSTLEKAFFQYGKINSTLRKTGWSANSRYDVWFFQTAAQVRVRNLEIGNGNMEQGGLGLGLGIWKLGTGTWNKERGRRYRESGSRK